MGKIVPKEFVLKDGRQGIIRHVEKSDAGSMLKLFDATVARDAYNVTTLADAEKMEMTIEKEEKYIIDHQKDGAVILGAVVDNALVGTVRIRNDSKQRIAHVGVLSISVDKEYRQNGVATALITTALEWAKNDPLVEKVALAVFANHTIAIDLYKRLGFVEEGRRIREFKIGPDEYADDIMMYQFVK